MIDNLTSGCNKGGVSHETPIKSFHSSELGRKSELLNQVFKDPLLKKNLNLTLSNENLNTFTSANSLSTSTANTNAMSRPLNELNAAKSPLRNGFNVTRMLGQSQANEMNSSLNRLSVEDQLLIDQMPFAANLTSCLMRSSKSCSDLKPKQILRETPPNSNNNNAHTSCSNNCDLNKNPETLPAIDSKSFTNILAELDLQYQSCVKEPEYITKKRYTWPSVLRNGSAEMRTKLKSFIPPNFKKSFSIFITDDDALTTPLHVTEEVQQTKCSTFMNSNWCLCLVVPAIIVCAVAAIAYLTSSYMQSLMFWIERQNPYLVMGILSVLYIIMCFPISFGFFLVKIVTGYLYGFMVGMVVTMTNSMIGVAVAHFVLRAFSNKFDCKRIVKNKTALAILKVIDGPSKFRIVIFTRFTPLPTGIQNLIFSLCDINWYTYLLATLIGMTPSEVLTVYLGSGFRTMQDILSTNGLIWPTYLLVAMGVLFGFILMTWIVLKAKNQLRTMIQNQEIVDATTTTTEV